MNSLDTTSTRRDVDARQLAHTARWAVQHLREEVKLLDLVIQSCRQLQTQLRQQPTEFESSLSLLRSDLDSAARDTIAGRQRLVQQLNKVAFLMGGKTNLSALAAASSSPWREQLTGIRREILDKLNLVRSITLANQTIMVYTMDFYQRMVAGLTGTLHLRNNPSNCYNAAGEIRADSTGNLLRRNC